MPKGYWIGGIDVDDPEAYKAYQAFVRPYITSKGGKFIVRGGQNVVKEGAMRPRLVVIEFPSYVDAVSAYEAAEYQDGKKLRLGASRADIVIVEGFDG